jgi:hypothetical protein
LRWSLLGPGFFVELSRIARRLTKAGAEFLDLLVQFNAIASRTIS